MTADVAAILVPSVIGLAVLLALGIWGEPLRRRFQEYVARQQDR